MAGLVVPNLMPFGQSVKCFDENIQQSQSFEIGEHYQQAFVSYVGIVVSLS